MNYSTSIAYNTRKGDLEPFSMKKYIVIKEQYIKAFSIIISGCCLLTVLFLASL